jgi:hypothetical protein
MTGDNLQPDFLCYENPCILRGNARRRKRSLENGARLPSALPVAITRVWALFSFGGCLILMGYANPEFRN